MSTLVLPPRFSADTQAIWRAAIEAGWDVERLQSWTVDPSLREREPVIYGESLWARAVAEQLWVTLVAPALDWTVRLPEERRRRAMTFTTLRDCNKVSFPAFVKPADEKSFSARVYPTLPALNGAAIAYEPSLPVIVSEPVQWVTEYRCFVSAEEITGSIYIDEGELAMRSGGSWPSDPAELRKALAVAREVFDGVPAVIDVGIIRGEGWAVVEANPAWASGLCGCDPAAVLRLLRACSVVE